MQRWRDSAWWTWAKRALTLAFFALVFFLLARYAQRLDWDEVLDSLKQTPAATLAAAAGLALCSHLLYSCFDLIGRHYTGHALQTRAVMAVTFISYAFNLCLGSLVGGIAFRYRLYSRLGLKNGDITRIVSMSMLTNWLGYMLLGGLLFLFHPLQLPPSWHMGNYGLQWAGAALLLVACGYAFACLRFGDHVWDWRGHEVYLPPWRVALVQLAVSCTNWSLMAGVVWFLLGRQIHYADVLTVLLIGAIAGVVTHVPAGLGVLEFVFVTLLSHLVSEGRLIGALLGYRAIYYIVPLVVAALLYLYMEVHGKDKHHVEGRRLHARGS
ncbi:membrane protein [Ramlibacter tataouinensis]|uniref:Membrane protein n=1 Tax=Ramlibacter tataouinensis TaxID=94132 RepID=A0A127JZI5_9BURK|nr:membrane protein [Ramlibacter tataouinensis]